MSIKSFFIVFYCCILAGCAVSSSQKAEQTKETEPQKRAGSHEPDSSSSTQNSQSGQHSPQSTNTSQGTHIPVSEWTGHQFVLLRINPQFSEYGHHLYTSPNLDRESSPPNSSIATNKHRLRHKPFAGHMVTVQNTKKTEDGEWFVTFLLDTLDLRLYAKTNQGVVEGIALANDLEKARDFFLGDTIYSRKRRIEMYDSIHQSFRNMDVSVTTPLIVHDICWGTTPLPSKPLWIQVITPQNDSGFIPVHFGTTNTITAAGNGELLWIKDILPENPRSYYQWDPYVWEVIDKHNIFEGMTSEQVLLSWGSPDKTERQQDCDTWVYNNSTLTFCKDTLVRHEN
ncbi:MAG: hypothetical protein ACOC41_05085 [Chitinivibrionales bacterium]